MRSVDAGAAALGGGFRWLRPTVWGLVLAYAAIGLWAMCIAPRVPYADAWRFLAHFLDAPFPRDVLAPDNGHHEVLPNLVRVVDLHVFAAAQWLQIAVGIALALATSAVLWRSARALQDADARAAAVLSATVGVFWLGNVRVLAHANETVHAYCVTLFVAAGLQVLARADLSRKGTGAATLAAACGLLAAFSFGSGIAGFAGFAAVLSMRRAHWRHWLVLAAGLFATLALLHWSGGTGAAPGLDPLSQAGALMRWLAGPFVYAAWPALDPAVAAQVPVGFVRDPMLGLANAYQATYGPVMLARWPHLLIGMAGFALLGLQGVRTWRRPIATALLGIGLSWFALAVGALIAVVRAEYFHVHPEQLLASRYLVWASLFWSGLAISAVAHARHARQALAIAMVVALLLLPSQAWMAELGLRMVHVAERTAVAGAVDVVEPGLELGETDPVDLAAALPRLRAARAAMFAWPESAWLQRTPPPQALALLAPVDMQVVQVGNRQGPSGRRVTFRAADVAGPRLLLIDRDGVVRGLALRDGGSDRWLGWMRGVRANAAPSVATLR